MLNIDDRCRLAYSQFSLCVKDVHIFHIKDNLNVFIYLISRSRIDSGNKVVFTSLQVNEDLVAHQLGYVNFAGNGLGGDPRRSELGVVDVFGSNTKYDLLTSIRHVDTGSILWDLHVE